jgi:hypothetical protein
MTEEEARARTAWRYAALAVALNIVGMPVELLIVRTIPQVPRWPALVSIGAALVLLGALLLRRRTPTVALGNAVFLLNTAVILFALWVFDNAYARSGLPWVPFQAEKLGMMTVALIAPEAWVGMTSIAAYAIVSLAQLVTFEREVRERLSIGEPWPTLAFAVFATVMLVYRLKRSEMERKFAAACAERDASEQVGRVLLAVRDLANTPLQTIAFAAETAREIHPDVGPVMDRVERSLAKLKMLEKQLHMHESRVKWTGREESLDALSLASRVGISR